MTQFMTEQGMVRVPAGTWDVDPAHSSAASVADATSWLRHRLAELAE